MSDLYETLFFSVNNGLNSNSMFFELEEPDFPEIDYSLLASQEEEIIFPYFPKEKVIESPKSLSADEATQEATHGENICENCNCAHTESELELKTPTKGPRNKKRLTDAEIISQIKSRLVIKCL
jgi:hypothetical protein